MEESSIQLFCKPIPKNPNGFVAGLDKFSRQVTPPPPHKKKKPTHTFSTGLTHSLIHYFETVPSFDVAGAMLLFKQCEQLYDPALSAVSRLLTEYCHQMKK